MRLACLMGESISDMIKWKVTVQHRLYAGRFDRRNHIFLMFAGADGNTA